MKKLFISILAASLFLLTGCLDNIQEITIHKDGSGEISSLSKMGAVFKLAKAMGGKDAMKDLEDKKFDTTFSLGLFLDSMKTLTADEKALIKDGKIGIDLNMAKEVFDTKFTMPFSNLNDIEKLNSLIHKIGRGALKEQMKNIPDMGKGMDMPDLGEMSKPSYIEDYFNFSFSKHKIERSLDKEKYKTIGDDKYLQMMKKGTAMGLPISYTLIINLPRKARKVKGENVKLSEDGKKLTIKTSLEDFFEHPEKLEFKFKY